MSLLSTILATAILSSNTLSTTTPERAPQLLSQVTELRGWNNVTWGMSQTEVSTLYPSTQSETRTYSDKPPKLFLINNQYPIGNYSYRLVFGFDNERLTSVALTWEGERANNPSREMQEALRGRYGEPDGRNSIGALEWFLPSTKVSLFTFELNGMYHALATYSETASGF